MHNASFTPDALHHDGLTAAGRAVTLQCAADTLRIVSAQGHLVSLWEQERVRAEFPHKTPLCLRLAGSGERLSVKNPALAETVRTWLSPALNDLRRARRIRWLLAGAASWAAAILLWFASPLLLTVAASCIPISWEEKLGQSAQDSLCRMLGAGRRDVLALGPGAEALQHLAARLAGPETGGYIFRVSLLRSRVANAFAMPGGYIVVTTSLVRQCDSPDELAGVLSHEMAHVTERHSTHALIRDELLSFAGRVFTGGSDVMGTVNKAGMTLLSLHFSREAEQQADLLGAHRLARAGIAPGALALFFRRLSTEEKSDRHSYLSSHPSTMERLEYLDAEAAKLKGNYTPALEPGAWRQLKALSAK